jgi:glucose/mannose transport system permease protein
MYSRALADSGFVDAAVNTFVLLLGFTLVTLAIGLGLAILIDRNIRFENTFRTIYLLPMSLSFVVTAQFWAWMYNFNNGVINIVLTSLGLGRVDWIGSPQIVLWAVVLALMWQFAGYAMVVFLAGLRAIPDEHYEAAKVDGASTLRMYWRVIIPQLKGSTISASVVLMVFALKAFDFLYSLVGGYRPPNGADILATKMVREAYANLNWAYASAIAIMLFLMALGIVGPYLYYQFKRGNL